MGTDVYLKEHYRRFLLKVVAFYLSLSLSFSGSN